MPPNPQKSTNPTAQTLHNLTTLLRHTAQQLTPPQPPQTIRYGNTPLIISASHATPHTRHNQTKPAEKLTGAIATQLARTLHATSLLPTTTQPDDPNYDTNPNTPYKTRLTQLINTNNYTLCVDIHGMKNQWGTDICVGTGKPNPTTTHYTEHLTQLIKNHTHLTVTINKPYASLHPGTIAQHTRTLGVAAVQLELSEHARTPNNLPTLLTALTRSLRNHPTHSAVA